MTLMEVSGLGKSFPSGRNVLGKTIRWTDAVKDVSFSLNPAETLAIIGESGAGKSTVGRLLLRLIEPDRGIIEFDGMDVRSANRREMRGYRRRVQMIFQDPYSSIDPRMVIEDAAAEPLLVHTTKTRRERLLTARTLLERVGIGSKYWGRFPKELSGGQLQRVAIARALTLDPAVIICDEPVAALDVSVRAQVLNLLLDLQEELGLSYLFIGHDLTLMDVFAERVMVMAGGNVIESGKVSDVFAAPKEEYTRRLLEAVPSPIPPVYVD